MFTLKKIDLMSVAMYSFLIILILSLIFIIPFGFIFVAMQNFIPDTGFPTGEFEGLFPTMGLVFIIGIPIFYSVVGTIINVLIAFIYNILSKKFGGIKFSLEKYTVVHETPE